VGAEFGLGIALGAATCCAFQRYMLGGISERTNRARSQRREIAVFAPLSSWRSLLVSTHSPVKVRTARSRRSSNASGQAIYEKRGLVTHLPHSPPGSRRSAQPAAK